MGIRQRQDGTVPIQAKFSTHRRRCGRRRLVVELGRWSVDDDRVGVVVPHHVSERDSP